MQNIEFPYSIEVEQAIINSLLTDKKSLYVVEKIHTDDFYIKAHATIFKSIKKLKIENKPIDIISVYEASKNIDTLDLTYLNEIMLKLLPTKSIEYYVEILKEKSTRRKIIEECKEAIAMAAETEEDPVSIKASLAQRLDNIGQKEEDDPDRLGDIFLKVYDQLENFDEDELKKYYTNIPELDRLTHGLHKEEVTVLAARPGVGKTAIALQIGKTLATRGLRVLFISREMSKEQVAKRILASERGIDGRRLRASKPNPEEWQKIIKTMGMLSDIPIFINTKAKNIAEIKSKIREVKADVLIIDYLQLLEPDNKTAVREQQVSELSREIKNISLDFKIPVLLLSQLNRQADTRRPNLSDLRESGAIEQDANNVLFLHLPTGDELRRETENGHEIININLIQAVKQRGHKIVQVIVAKQRDGELGEFYMEYIPRKLTFVSYSNR